MLWAFAQSTCSSGRRYLLSVNEDLIGPYVVYLAVAAGLTAWLIRTAIRYGDPFMHGVLKKRPEHASPMAHLVASGVAATYLGIALHLMQPNPATYQGEVDAVAFLVGRVGALLILFGVLNLVPPFARWQRRARAARPPLPPAGFGRLPAPPPPAP